MPLLGFFGDLLKKQPDIPKFKPISAGDEQLKAIRSNTSAIAEIRRLAQEADQLSAEQFKARLDAIGAGGTAENIGRNIASMTRGEIPEDVAAAVERRGAARSYSGGYGGSERAGFLRTRDLGLTSLDLTQKGLDNATRWLQFVQQSSPQFDVTSMFLTPEQQLKNTWMNTEAQMNNQWMRNQQDAAGNVGTLFGNALNQADAFVQQAAISFAGGMGVGKGLGSAGARPGASAFNSPADTYSGSAIPRPPSYNYSGY